MSADLENPVFTNEDAAREHLEKMRWPNGAVCPRCGGQDRVVKMEGPSYRAGLYECRKCRRQFTATIGTIFERSHIPLHTAHATRVGQFLAEWSMLELLLEDLIWTLAGIDHHVGRLFTCRLDVRPKSEIMDALLKLKSAPPEVGN